MKAFSRITRDPAIMSGKPCIRGMRLTVRRVLDIVASYKGDIREIQSEFPELEPEDVREAIAFAGAYLENEVIDYPKVEQPRTGGQWEGKASIGKDFNDPLPDEILKAFVSHQS